ncbi:hypothetical phage protein [Yersinia enterocolitica subsp. enterocolitica 8081]|uniref:Hypothetical phage protein n=1 Tax=Yersinia enterocolitica serotype O:8 / biotype 1B (strain NCTC 13174 / 8081) TaxID=393305 RepID=A1JR69_YERE8|nr:hypothetical phage protein [Yersinia enterocolitica subsp. enterocolitica 8081]
MAAQTYTAHRWYYLRLVSLRFHHIPKPTNLWFPASRREQTPSMLNKQPVFLTGAASSSVCRIDVSFRWNDYSNAYY